MYVNVPEGECIIWWEGGEGLDIAWCELPNKLPPGIHSWRWGRRKVISSSRYQGVLFLEEDPLCIVRDALTLLV